MSTNRLIDAGLVYDAFNIVRPGLEALFRTGLTKRPTIYVAVGLPSGSNVGTIFGEGRETWQRPYDEIAAAKLELCKRTGLDSRVVVFTQPWLLQPGDVKYGGGVCRDGICAAASGNAWYHDQMIAEWVVSTIQALVRAKVQPVLDDAAQDYLPLAEALETR